MDETTNRLNLLFEEFKSDIQSIVDAINNCLDYQKDSLATVTNSNKMVTKIKYVFKDIECLKNLYRKIQSCSESQSNLPNALLNENCYRMLQFFLPFLQNYSSYIPILGELQQIVSWPQSLEYNFYTIFNSPFKLHYLISQYVNLCTDTEQPDYCSALEVQAYITKFLQSTGLDKKLNFFETHHELNYLSKRTRIPCVNVSYIGKIEVPQVSSDDQTFPGQLVLFSDCLYITHKFDETTLTNCVQHEISLDLIEFVHESCSDLTESMSSVLRIKTVSTYINVQFDSIEDFSCWKDKLKTAVDICKNRNAEYIFTWLGKVVPKMQSIENAKFCNRIGCTSKFTHMNKIHHCNSDGLLYCLPCLPRKLSLPYYSKKQVKVCELCFRILYNELKNPEGMKEAKLQLKSVFANVYKTGRILEFVEVQKYNISASKLEKSQRYYAQLCHDPLIKFYCKSEDKICNYDIMLLGANICTAERCVYHKPLNSNEMALEHESHLWMLIIKCDTEEKCNRWKDEIRRSLSTFDETSNGF